MGTFSVWHWVIVFTLIVILAPVLGIIMAGKEREIGRLAYAFRAGGVIFLSLVAQYLVRNSFEIDPSNSAFVGLGILAINTLFLFLLARWSVHRLSEIGISRWAALFLIVPLLNIILVLSLCFLRGKEQRGHLGDNQTVERRTMSN